MAHDNLSSGSAAFYEEAELVVAESESFAAFERRMDEQLEALVALWIHTAAPNASRSGRSRQEFGR